jgi:hypothetical protein
MAMRPTINRHKIELDEYAFALGAESLETQKSMNNEQLIIINCSLFITKPSPTQ